MEDGIISDLVYNKTMNNQEQPLEGGSRSVTVEQDPFQKSYQDSAIQYLPYRVFLLIAAIALLQVGKASLPEDAVPCIEDLVNDGFQPVADFFNENPGFGQTLKVIMQLLCDLQLVGMAFFWIAWGNSLIYPIALASLGTSKILINILFKTRSIENAFDETVYQSLLFSDNFKNTYFFSGITALLVINLLQFWRLGWKRLFYAECGISVYVIFLLLSMRLNFFMDIVTAMAFGYIVYATLWDYSEKIDQFLLSNANKMGRCLNRQEEQSA